MFTDYLTLLLVNMAGGLVVLAGYLICGLDREDRASWAPAFAAPGLVAFVVGLHMTLTWPIPNLGKVNLSWANIAFGELSVLFGALLLGAALACWRGWSWKALSIYALIPAATAVVVGAAVWSLWLTKSPIRSGIAFILTGVGGLLVAPAVWCAPCRKPLRWLAAAVLLAAAAIWTWQGLGAYWGHLARFSTAAK